MVNPQQKNLHFSKGIESIELFIKADKLHSIQVSLERFLEKWTKKNVTDLEVPKKFKNRKKVINFAQWVNRFALTSAGVLTLNGHPKIGGSISVFYPLIELFISSLKEKIEKKDSKWGDFFRDSESLANRLNSLLAITDSIKNLSLGEINNASEKLNDKVYDFLKEYDKNQDKRIDISELKIGKFVKDLKKKWGTEKEKKMREIAWEVQTLHQEVVNYRHRLYTQRN